MLFLEPFFSFPLLVAYFAGLLGCEFACEFFVEIVREHIVAQSFGDLIEIGARFIDSVIVERY